MNSNLWQNKQMKGIEFAEVSYYSYQFKPHFHEHYVIQTVKEGVNIGECQRQPYEVGISDILLINPSEIHTGSSWQSQLLHYVALYVSVDFFKTYLENEHTVLDKTICFEKIVIRDRHLADLLREIVKESSYEHSEILTETLVLFFSKLFQEYTRLGTTPKNEVYCRKYVRKGLVLMQENYALPFSVTDYCKQENISCYSFIRSFRHLTGLTPGQFLINYRVEQAKKLLQRQFSLSDVCWETGFFDQSHFNRHFKVITGLTPGQYRNCFT